MVSFEDTTRTRRAVMVGAAGAIVATAAQAALGRPQPAAATNGQAVTIGATRTGEGPTALVVTQAASSGIYGFGVTDRGVNSFTDSATIGAHTKGVYDTALLGMAEGHGTGVTGRSVSGIGVLAHSEASTGLKAVGVSSTATAVEAVAAQGGVAIRAFGRLQLLNVSGVATIAAGQTSVVVTPGVDVTRGAIRPSDTEGQPCAPIVVVHDRSSRQQVHDPD